MRTWFNDFKTFLKLHFHKKTAEQKRQKWEKEKLLLETEYQIDSEKR